MTIDEIRKIKAELGYSNKVLAERAGIPLGTLQKVHMQPELPAACPEADAHPRLRQAPAFLNRTARP